VRRFELRTQHGPTATTFAAAEAHFNRLSLVLVLPGEASKRALRQFVVREQMRLPEERRVGGDRTDGDLGFEGIDVDVSTRVKLQGLETARDGPAQEQKGTVLALQVLFNHDQLPINLS